MCKTKTIVHETVKYFFIGVTIIQAILGMIWLVNNIGIMPFDSVSNDYIEASKSLVVDEYMGILYSLLIRVFGHGSILYIIQIATLALAFIYSLSAITKSPWIYLYIMTVPAVLQICCSVLPKAFILATVLITLSSLYTYFLKKQTGKLIIASISALFGILLNRDLIWLLAILFVVSGVTLIIKREKKSWQLFLAFLLILILGLFINAQFTEKDAFGRYERNGSYLVFQKVCWPDLNNLNDIMNTYYDLDFHYELINAQNEPQVLPKVVYFINQHIGDASMDAILEAAVDFKVRHGLRDYLLPSVKDCIYNIFPGVGTFWVVKNNIENTGVYSCMERFCLKAPDISRVVFLFNLFSGFALPILGLFCFVLSKELNRKFLLGGLLIVITEALYFTLFSVPGFDYRNVFFAILFWTLIFILPLFENDSERTDS